MTKNPFLITSFVIFAAVMIAVIISLVDRNQIENGSSLPTGATQVVHVGGGWYEFTYKNQRFLFYKNGIGDHTHAALVRLETHEH